MIVAAPGATAPEEQTPAERVPGAPIVQVFLAALVVLLTGYAFLGRGFAHLGLGPLYVGELVLFVGILAAAWAVLRYRLRVAFTPLVWLVLALMAWGIARTVPYLTTYGIDALRDAVLWGYALFALIVYVLFDRERLFQGARIYGWILPAFALWLPISFWIFWYTPIDMSRPASDIPLIFWKGTDMAVHATGAIAFLLFCSSRVATLRTFVWRSLVAYPMVWTYFYAWSLSRGAMLAAWAGLGVAAVLGYRLRNWVVVGGAIVIFLVVQTGPVVVNKFTAPAPSPSVATPAPGASPVPSAQPGTGDQGNGREITVDQIAQNLWSILGGVPNSQLAGTASFRLAWWTAIIDYTVNGPYLWLGKGFGINLADDDGFQVNEDGSLRAPHNSHMTALARMGVPGFLIWVLFQAAFAVGLLRAVLRLRRAGDTRLAGIGAWLLVYWAAIMVDTSFDPYLESPQGGIWFWTVIGLGLVVMNLKPEREAAK